MKLLTSKKFRALIKKYPSWAATLQEPVIITDYCNMSGSPITHLSPLLHFVGLNERGECANFMACEYLTVAEGSFAGEVDFSYSFIRNIGDLTIKKAGKSGNAADFTSCEKLLVATGQFPGAVTFKGSGIQRVVNLNIHSPNQKGLAAEFYFCKHLRHAEGYYLGHVSFYESGIERIGILNASSACFVGCVELRDAANPAMWLDHPRADFDPETRSRLEAIRNL